MLVHERVHDEFLDEVVDAAAEWRLGDPFDDKTLVGPMNNEPTASRPTRCKELLPLERHPWRQGSDVPVHVRISLSASKAQE